MTTEREYHLIAIIETKDKQIKTLQYEIQFSTDPEDYGNGTYLRIGDDLYYDIRYDMNYNPKREILYLTEWASNRWSGENGSRELITIQINKKAPLTSR